MTGLQIAAFCLASFFLGVALTLKVIFDIAQRQQEGEHAEGCLCNLVAVIPLALAATLFVAGVMGES